MMGYNEFVHDVSLTIFFPSFSDVIFHNILTIVVCIYIRHYIRLNPHSLVENDSLYITVTLLNLCEAPLENVNLIK